eukprot:gnl/Chilomastix_caulleri/6538.p1 GENE.gnl/Chilomastix_caulleri/6538~~gnl/Chilomastix_caulleri/6538.p1  ORF type:complete len:104 (+),score=10.04 gnl/Chilomastix_caulleri/6538:135-446(+)
MTFELFADIVPRTAENFRQLCIGYQAQGKHLDIRIAHSIVLFQTSCAKEVISQLQWNWWSFIYGSRFADENFRLQHTGFGCLSMAFLILWTKYKWKSILHLYR